MSSVMQTSTMGMTGTGLRSAVLADRLERGAEALAALAGSLSDAAWKTKISHDGRSVGVVVHHVASVYPVEIQLAQALAAGQPITGVVWDTVHEMNAKHAAEFAAVSKDDALSLLRENSRSAAAAIRALDDNALDSAATASLYDDAPITCQFMLEDHAVRHSYHHLAGIKRTLQAAGLL
jgi:hypothetical protein